MLFGQNAKAFSNLFQEDVLDARIEEVIPVDDFYNDAILSSFYSENSTCKSKIEPFQIDFPKIEHNTTLLILFDCCNYDFFKFNRPPPSADNCLLVA